MAFVPGSILKRRISGFAGWFYHHMGIYLADDFVVHFNGERKKSCDAIIRADTLQAFGKGCCIFPHATPKNSNHAAAICQEALRLLQLEDGNGWNKLYNFVGKNCEDFCVHCYQVPYI